jgi:predicted CoA-binding protein
MIDMSDTIAIIGASADRGKFGNKAVRAYLKNGYRVFPVHPTATEIEGQPAYRSVLDVPLGELDRISIYLPRAVLRPLLDEIAQKPAREVWFNPGADAPDIVERARFLGMNAVVGCSIVDIGVSPYELD